MRLLLTYIILLATTIITVSANYRFETINNLAGLRSDYVSSVCQDDRGFVWIATSEGLHRYDGAAIKFYNPIAEDNNPLYTKEIHQIKRLNNTIWLATTNGLFEFDTIRERFRKLNTEGIPVAEILVLELDKTGNIWLGNKRGLYLYNPKTDSTTPIAHNSQLTTNNVRTLFCDSKEDLWIGYWSGELVKFDHQNKIFKNIEIDDTPSSIVSIYEQDNTLYIGRWDGSILTINSNSHKATIIHRLSKNRGDLPIYSIFYHQQSGNYWITTSRGLFMLDQLENPQNTTHITATQGKGGLPNNNVAATTYSPDEQILWLATRGGGLCYTSLAPKFIDETTLEQINPQNNSSGVRAIAADSNKLWIALQNDGLFHSDDDGKFIKTEFGTQKINTLLRLKSQNELWIGNRGGGVTIVDPDSMSSQNLLIKAHPNIIALFEDSKGQVWIGCNNGLMVARYSDSQWVVEDLTPTINYRQTIVGVAESSNGDIWIATRRNGVYRIGDNEVSRYNVTTADGLVYNNILSIYCDSSDNIWLGMSSLGLLGYNRTTDSFSYSESVVGSDIGSVCSIIEHNNTLWMGSNRGVYCYNNNPTAPSLLRFTIDDGVVNNISLSNSIARSDEGNIYIGAHNGFTTIDTDILYNTSSRSLEIADIKVGNTTILYPNLSSAIERGERGEIKALRLKHNQRDLLFQLTSLTFEDHFNNRYAYMLEELDREWIEVNHSNPELLYNNLPWGKYRFLARNLNDKEGGSISIDIIILTPIYARWWAVLLYILIISYIIYDMVSNRRIRNSLTQRLQIAIEHENENDNENDNEQTHPNRTAVSLGSSEIVDDYQSLDEQFLAKAVEVINQNIDNSEFDNTQFTEAMGVTNSMLYRKIKSMTGMSPNGFVRHVRLEVAHKLITEKYQTITTSEVAYAVGFNIPKYFTKCFTKQFGMTPSAYRATLLE